MKREQVRTQIAQRTIGEMREHVKHNILNKDYEEVGAVEHVQVKAFATFFEALELTQKDLEGLGLLAFPAFMQRIMESSFFLVQEDDDYAYCILHDDTHSLVEVSVYKIAEGEGADRMWQSHVRGANHFKEGKVSE
jgi:hypothetical protein